MNFFFVFLFFYGTLSRSLDSFYENLITHIDYLQAWIEHLKEVSQNGGVLVLPFISNSDLSNLSRVSLSELRCQDPTNASDFFVAAYLSI